jgi:uroporphyrinogen decarboxylase
MDALEMQGISTQRSNYENLTVPQGELSPRERFFRIMEGRKPDRIIDTEFGYWDDTLKRWHAEGLPLFVDSNQKADIYFGFDDWQRFIPVGPGLHPGFEKEIVERAGRTMIIYDHEHVKCQVFTDGTDTIPHYLEFPVKDLATYRNLFKDRLLPRLEERIPKDIAEIGRKVKDRNYVLSAWGGSAAGWARNWMGFEGICFAIHDQPELLEEMMEDIARLGRSLAEAIVRHMTPDSVSYWEDIAFKTGPIVPPVWYMKSCGPVFRAAMDVFRKAGTKYAWVDCDGDMKLLVPTWLESGVNIMFPLEVNSGVHPEDLRKKFPCIRMIGGVDKVMLLKGQDAIRKELLRLKPLVEEGGFIPHVDHRVQADVSFKDYLYYLEAKRDIFGIPNAIRSA